MHQDFPIHVIVKYFFPVAAGIETNIGETYSVLAAHGWDVNIHTSTNTLTETNILKAKETHRGLHIKRYLWQWWGFAPDIDLQVPSLICLHNFNVFPHAWLMAYTLFLKLLGKKRFQLILTPHGGFTPEWDIFPLPVRIGKWLYHRTLGALLVNVSVDGVRAVSSWERLEMLKYGLRSDIVEIISNGIENRAFEDLSDEVSAEYKAKIQNLGEYIVQIGRIHQIKNLTTSIKALALVPGNMKLVIAGPVGEQAYLDLLKQMIADMGLQDRVIFWGVVRDAEKFYLLKQAQLMLHMAIWESYCNVVHEAMSQGLVCLVADNTALPLLIKNGINGYCLPTHDEKAVAEKIAFVMKHKKDRVITDIEEHNRTSVVEHSWSNVAKKLEQFYQRKIAAATHSS